MKNFRGSSNELLNSHAFSLFSNRCILAFLSIKVCNDAFCFLHFFFAFRAMGKYHKKVRDFSSETLLAILNDVRSKRISLRTAASSLKVSVNFIRDRVTGKISVDQAETRGRKTVLKSEEEEELADYLRILAKWGHGFLRKETILIVGEFCESNNRVTPFKSGIPGKDWYAGFSKRHNLKLGNTEQLEKCRLKNTANPFMVYPFYDMLESEARALDIVNKPEHFWSLDEIGASKDPTKAKIVAGAVAPFLFLDILPRVCPLVSLDAIWVQEHRPKIWLV